MSANQPSLRLALILLCLPMLFFNCQSPQDNVTQLNFAFGPDATGSVQALIDKFNQENEGLIQVNWLEQAPSTNDYYHDLADLMESKSSKIDVFGADVIWTPALATQGWSEDLSSQFNTEFKPSHFVEAAMNSTIYQNAIWGIPWYTDKGVLFYRKDLLQGAGYDDPPKTLAELKKMIDGVRELSAIEHGFVFQGDPSEAGVTNACEFIWNAGGDILLSDMVTEMDVITVDNDHSRAGLASALDLITAGYAPGSVTQFREADCLAQFNQGKAIFMRNWPTAYGEIGQTPGSIQKSQVGLAPLVTLDESIPSQSCLGGWNLMINPFSDVSHREAAWKFISYMTSPSSQRFLAHQGGHLPGLADLYQDEMLLDQVPTIALANAFIENGRSRPFTPDYLEISPLIGDAWNRILRSEVDIDKATQQLNQGLNEIVAEMQ